MSEVDGKQPFKGILFVDLPIATSLEERKKLYKHFQEVVGLRKRKDNDLNKANTSDI